ncbi:hypothetical protein TRFO_24116 [Tritrichomonas foetus]|uniref:Myb-like DNA-binding domain containing protein n=1 Tax=Tritrichomonas foetus TaxID=1144522 RepID=A0A1J4K802_9EUKA|nr:hypothetical protein TRFO_24116 [Tritrichomonas foetus]|eukprot:OHT07625.1 hypothetical protein TRFO_24116 [Tritrichomonas foetus]
MEGFIKIPNIQEFQGYLYSATPHYNQVPTIPNRQTANHLSNPQYSPSPNLNYAYAPSNAQPATIGHISTISGNITVQNNPIANANINPAIQPSGLANAAGNNYACIIPTTLDYVTRGAWSTNEDTLLRNAVLRYGTNHWDNVACTIPGRTPTQCRERWMFRISPGLKKSPFEPWEDDFIIAERAKIGNHWTQIASQLPGRTSCAVKNRWYTVLRKHASKKDVIIETRKCAIDAVEIKNLLSQPVEIHANLV